MSERRPCSQISSGRPLSTFEPSPGSEGGIQTQLTHHLTLPNELLAPIISTAAEWPDDIDGADLPSLYADRWAMALVCRRFYQLANPILYSQIVLTVSRIVNRKVTTPRASPAADVNRRCSARHPGAAAVRLLRRTMATNPRLRDLCVEMVLDMAHPLWEQDSLFRCAEDLVGWLGNTRSLRLHESQSRDTETREHRLLLAASKSMLRLESLAFTTRRGTLTDPMTYHSQLRMSMADRFPALKHLHLAGLFRDLAGSSSTPSNYSTQAMSPQPGGSSYTELSIHDYQERPHRLAPLINWPARLEKFTLLGQSRWGYSNLKLKTLCSVLIRHMRSLKSIRIGSVISRMPPPHRAGMLAGVDFGPFESLTSLCLSYWGTGSGSGAAGLLAPRLETFEWSFDAEDNRPLYLGRFQHAEEDFLRQLAHAAAGRGVPLRRIDIVFSPALATGPTTGAGAGLLGVADVPLEYPWDRMDRLAGELRPLGVQLTYNKPSVTREEYERAVLRPTQYLGSHLP